MKARLIVLAQSEGDYIKTCPVNSAIRLAPVAPAVSFRRGQVSSHERMAVFSSRPFNPNATSNKVNSLFRRYPLLFGGPFIAVIVGASFAMTQFTQTRYEVQKQKTQQVRRALVLNQSA